MHGEALLIDPAQDAGKAMPNAAGSATPAQIDLTGPFMFRTSISKLLISIQGVILLSLLTATGIIAVQGWNDYRAAGAIQNATETDRVLFDTILAIRNQSAKLDIPDGAS